MVYIVILNWNGWQDTLGCVQSLLGLQETDYRIIICDNGSTDGSIERIKNLVRGEADLAYSETKGHPIVHPRLDRLTHYHSSLKHISMNVMTLTELDEQSAQKNSSVMNTAVSEAKITLILNEKNLGFAAGNNSGIGYALAQEDMSHVWLLNNDTLVEPDSLKNMLKRLKEKDRLQSGICGLRVMFFDDPTIVQALGGNRFNRWTGMASASLGRFSSEKAPRDTEAIESEIDYVSGCSTKLPKATSQLSMPMMP